MTPERLAEIEAREKAATAGPWVVREYPDCYPLIKMPGDEIQDITYREDADFIAFGRADIPDLCRALREAWARIDTLEKSSCK